MKKNMVEKVKLLISLLSQYVKYFSECQIEDKRFKKWFKEADDVVRTANQAWNWESSSPKPCIELVVFNLDNLVSIKENLDSYFLDYMPKNAEHLLHFIDSLLQNLKVVFTYIDNSIVLMMAEVLEDVEQRLMLLRNLLFLVPLNGLIEKQDSSVRMVVVWIQVLSLSVSRMLYILCTEDDGTDISDFRDKYPVVVGAFDTIVKEEVNDICEDYRKLFIATIADDDDANMDDQVLAIADYLIHKLRLLSDNEAPYSVVAPKDQIDILVDELSFLRCNLMDLLLRNPMKEMKSLVISTQVVIFRIGLFVYLSLVAKEDDTIAEYYSLRLYDLLKVVDNVKKQASDILKEFFFSRSWQSNCPSANVLEHANFLINKLDELSRAEESDPRNAALKHQIETAYEEIVSVTKLLRDVAAHLGNSQIEYLLTRYKDAAYQAEFVIDSFVAGEGSTWCHELGIFVVTKDIKILHKEVKSLVRMTMSSDSVIPGFSSGASSHTNNEIHNRVEEAANKIVGFKDAEEEIIELLTGGSRQLKIVSIVGMPGLGKTTLANSVYKHPSINLHFHVHVWCCLSQVYEKDTLLFDILGQIVGKTIQSHETSQEDLVQKLYQSLKGRKYLIVIDDIWDTKAWNDLKGPFPDDDNGSRILVTTRHRAVALEVNSIPYALRMLSQEESCKLLWIKVFGGEICPPELLAVSERIARNCKGLPLAVILTAGILKKKERKENYWEHVSIKLISSEVSDILEYSYKHLPDCLKTCFLYFATFPEDTTISASKLIQLWICEGFLQQPNLDQISLEQEAENYLNDLVNRNLVMIGKRRSKGGVKACHIHDVLHEFCSIKLQDERLLMQEHMFGGIFVLHGDRGMHIRSLLYHKGSDRAFNFIRTRLDYGFILQYQLLRVLDLGIIGFSSSADTSDLVDIAKLVQLRYLAIRISTNKIPSEIGNLQNLETFVLSGEIGEVMLPESIWNLVNLAHILIHNSFFSFQHCNQDFFGNFSRLNKLKSISALSLCHADDVEKFVLRRLTGIQKLGCKFSNSWDDSTGCNIFPVLDILKELESLKVFFRGKTLYPCKFSFPSNLRKLSISNSRLPWDEISYIGQLPNLEVLKLLNKAFEGQQWEMREGEFEKLKFLKLDSLDIEQWNASNENLPCLEQLVVVSCKQLMEVPSTFGEIPTLQLIEMKWCSSSATDSIKQILEEQRDMSNNQLNVNIVGMVESRGRADSGSALSVHG